MNPFELPEWLVPKEATSAAPAGGTAGAEPDQPAPDPAILGRNLRALAPRSPAVARAIETASASTDVRFVRAEDGAWSATWREPGSVGAPRQMASLRRPLDEATKLAAAVPIEAVGGFVVMGFGLGHHVAALAARLGRAGVIFAFEPDVRALRAVLERIDHSAWIESTNFVLLTRADDPASISAAAQGVEGLLAMGVKFVDHPPSKARLGKDADVFAGNLAGVMRALRTTIVTTLVQVDTTLRNTLMNLDRYAAAPGIGELEGAAAGRAAVVVAAGPSLERNLAELARPGVRDRVVIIAVQTVLKKMLARGIVPHFVTALDHADLSARFYEGLTARDVEGCTLVVQAMANPSIFAAYPGAVRCPGDGLSDQTLGNLQSDRQRESRGTLRPGATVAHMAYYLARHLGCDPVILVGQDLGFTDGQYYSAGAAIHRVWSGELSGFNTLEMMEWQRIVRAKSMLHRATDVLGRPIYTDEQMTTYLAQFERDFAVDEREGRSTIDATEGGVAKRHTHAMTLREAIAQFADERSTKRVQLPPAIVPSDAPSAPRVAERVRQVRREAHEVASVSRATAQKLREMTRCASEPRTVNRLIEEVYALRDQAMGQATGYALTQFLNQTGAFNRAKADRAIELDRGLSPKQRQERQIERDIKNVTWLADAAEDVGEMLDATVRAIKSGVKRTRPAQPRIDETAGASVETTVGSTASRAFVRRGEASSEAASESKSERAIRARSRARVLAYIQVDLGVNGLGVPRDLARPIVRGLNPLAMTVRRLAACRELDGVVVVASDPERARALIGPLPPSLDVKVLRGNGELIRSRAQAVGAARLFTPHAWRGGLGGLSVYDEAVCPRVAATALEACPADGLLVVGADWALVDPTLCDAAVTRFRENPDLNSLAFTQAPPGLAGCVVTGRLLSELGARQDEIGPIASIGGMLSYIPVAPLGDPIAKPACVGVPPVVRDACERFIPDSSARTALLSGVIDRACEATASMSAERIVNELALARTPAAGVAGPEILRLEITTRRSGRGLRAGWFEIPTDTSACIEYDTARVRAVIDRARQLWPDAALSLEGRGDPLLHSAWREILDHAVAAGFPAVHVRTDLGAGSDVDGLLATLRRASNAVLSVDLLAASHETYETLTGVDWYEQVTTNLRLALEKRAMSAGLLVPWIVPRMTRCDAVYSELEYFYDFWLMTAGAAVIDPLPRAVVGERIAPLPLPENVLARTRRRELVVRADGSVAADSTAPWANGASAINAEASNLAACWEHLADRASRNEGDQSEAGNDDAGRAIARMVG